MKDFQNVLKSLKGSKVIDYKILFQILGHKPCGVWDKEAELIFKLCEWQTNDTLKKII